LDVEEGGMPVEDELTAFAPSPTSDELRREWAPPDFEELPTSPEVTAYAGTWV